MTRSIMDHRPPCGNDWPQKLRAQRGHTIRGDAHVHKPCSAERFSEGSKDHASGNCKPCAFFHEKGCQTGAACNFCHLCPPREVQRRKRVRRRIAREQLARDEYAAHCNTFHSYGHNADFRSPIDLGTWDPYSAQWTGSQAFTEDAVVSSGDDADE